MYLMETVAVTPIVTEKAIVWVDLETYLKTKLMMSDKIQRLAFTVTTKAKKIRPTTALKALLHLGSHKNEYQTFRDYS